MGRNDEKLESMLRRAKGCLRSGRCPGERTPRHRGDASAEEDLPAAAGMGAAADPDEGEHVRSTSSTAPPVPPTPEGLSPAEHDVKLRQDILRLQHHTSRKRQELEVANLALAKEVLRSHEAQDKAHAVDAKVQETRMAVKKVRSMYRIQDMEIRSLQSALERMEALCAADSTLHATAPPKKPPAKGQVPDGHAACIMGVDALEPHLVPRHRSYVSVLAPKDASRPACA